MYTSGMPLIRVWGTAISCREAVRSGMQSRLPCLWGARLRRSTAFGTFVAQQLHHVRDFAAACRDLEQSRRGLSLLNVAQLGDLPRVRAGSEGRVKLRGLPDGRTRGVLKSHDLDLRLDFLLAAPVTADRLFAQRAFFSVLDVAHRHLVRRVLGHLLCEAGCSRAQQQDRQHSHSQLSQVEDVHEPPP